MLQKPIAVCHSWEIELRENVWSFAPTRMLFFATAPGKAICSR